MNWEFNPICLKSFFKLISHIFILIILNLGSNFYCFNGQTNLTPGSLLLRKYVFILFLFNFNDGGVNLVLFLRFTLHHWASFETFLPKWINTIKSLLLCFTSLRNTRFIGFLSGVMLKMMTFWDETILLNGGTNIPMQMTLFLLFFEIILY